MKIILLLSFLFVIGAHAQIRPDQLNKIKAGDEAETALNEWHAELREKYDKGGDITPILSGWWEISSETTEKLFPESRFFTTSWFESKAPESKKQHVALAGGLGITVVWNRKDKVVVQELYHWGNYEAFGSFIKEKHVRVRNNAEADELWIAFCEIHQRHWKSNPHKQQGENLWHLGISSYNQTVSTDEATKTEVTRTHYKKLTTKPKSGFIVSWESSVETSDQRITPTK